MSERPERKDQGQCGRAKNSPCGLALSVCRCMQVPASGSRAAKTGREQECWRKCGAGDSAGVVEAWVRPRNWQRLLGRLRHRNDREPGTGECQLLGRTDRIGQYHHWGRVGLWLREAEAFMRKQMSWVGQGGEWSGRTEAGQVAVPWVQPSGWDQITKLKCKSN